MRRAADWLYRIGGLGFIASMVGMLVSGIVAAFGSDVTAPAIFIWSALILFACILMLIIAHCIDQHIEEQAYEARRSKPRPKIELQPMEKPAGYNRAVLHWFDKGPELRERDADFHKAFSARAKVPTAKKR